MDVVASDELTQRLGTLPPAQIVDMLIEGTREESGPIARALNEEGFAFPPLPNLFFPRDIGMVHRPARRGRLDALRRPLDRGAADQGAVHAFIPSSPTRACCTTGRRSGAATTPSKAATCTTSAPTCWCVGFSERTSPAALDELCDTVFAQGAVTDVIVVVMPKAPTAIHLDMIFTHVDRELCVIYPPYFVGPERLAVLHRRKGRGRRAREAQLLRGAPRGRAADGGGVRRRAASHQPGARAVELGVQLPGGAARARS